MAVQDIPSTSPLPAARRAPNSSPRSVIQWAQEQGLQIVDLKFVDLPGLWQHFSVPISELKESVFADGLGFDGSSIRGWQKINESDMLVVPDPATAVIDPVCKVPTLSLVCDIVDPVTRQPYTRDPRNVARKAERYLTTTGIADTSYWGPECEFYIFNDIRFHQDSRSGYYFIDSDEGIWNSGLGGVTTSSNGRNLGYRPRYKEGYFPVAPTDKLQDLRSRMILKMIETGIDIEVQHHEVGTAGQAEIDMRFDTMVTMADKVMMYKYIVKNVAYDNGYTVTFMPKPIFGDNGSGMHTHQSLWKEGTNLFFDANSNYALMSDLMRWYIGGLLKHCPSILAFAAPSTNSYRRLVPGYEAPINLVYSQRNRSACVRIPMYSNSPAARRLEFRIPDPSCNPYLSFSACLMAGLDGIMNRIEPPPPVDEDIYELEPEAAAKIQSAPGSLNEVLDALEQDHEFLLRGDVFTKDLIDTWIDYKRTREVEQVALRPHPYEFHLYFDI
ncbi:MAG TPA: type I glutamate--ammonia ligase [Chloroflexota bacterium]|nr:type I glutamate--ammonia ligase [Chloroflexota bacterium]